MPVFPPNKNQPSQDPPKQPAAKSSSAPLPQSARWKPTAEEQVEIEDLTYSLLSAGLLKSQIKKQLRNWAKKKEKEIATAHPGIQIQMDARTIERYLSRARGRLVEESGKSKEELRAESLNFYLTITRDITADPRSRIQARERIDRLYGLDQPIKVAPTDPSGDRPYSNLSDAELATRIAELVAAGDAGGTALPAGNADSGGKGGAG